MIPHSRNAPSESDRKPQESGRLPADIHLLRSPFFQLLRPISKHIARKPCILSNQNFRMTVFPWYHPQVLSIFTAISSVSVSLARPLRHHLFQNIFPYVLLILFPIRRLLYCRSHLNTTILQYVGCQLVLALYDQRLFIRTCLLNLLKDLTYTWLLFLDFC